MTAKVRELKELKALAEELAAEIACLEDEIKAIMTDQGVDELNVDIYKIRWKYVVGSRLDTAALKKAMPELAQQFTRQTKSRRFYIA